MLLEFTVENFRSIADRQTLSFVAGKHVSEAAGMPAVEAPGFSAGRVLTSVVIYGANASGKSNVLRALNWMMYLVRSASPAQREDTSYRLDAEWAAKPTRFELTFLKDDTRYQYGFAVDGARVHEEWLIAYPKKAPQLWFERRPGAERIDIHFGPSLRGEKARIASLTRPDALFLSVAAQLNHPQLSGIRDWLAQHVIAQRSEGFGPLHTARLLEPGASIQAVAGQLLKAADLGIAGIQVRRHSKLPDAKSGVRWVMESGKADEFFEVLTEHRRTDGSKVLFDLLDDESQGTVRFFELVQPIMAMMGGGGLIAVDELDQCLHPLMVRKIISLFHDPATNPHHAQLLFNTHDTTLLDPRLFRRDQIWFTEKDQAGKTRLYSLLDYSPRKEEALQRGYLLGRYGAIPFLDGLRFPVPLTEEAPALPKRPR